MRIDLISIFPEFFDALDLSLIGRAQEDGLLDVRRHQLRDYAADRHRTVDSPPAGGGAGMVMKPEPWALALESVLSSRAAGTRPTLIIPTPSGEVLSQSLAHEFAAHEHLVFAPGRFGESMSEWPHGQRTTSRCAG